MASQVTEYKCPACTAPLRYDGATQKLVCDYCGSSYEVEAMEALYAAKNEAAAQVKDQLSEDYAKQMWGDAADKLKAYSCPSCGAELVVDENTAATCCPYCGNQTIVPKQLEGDFKPEYIIPFKLDKKDAIAALKKHYEGKPLLPAVFKNQNHIEEIQGVYVPFWLFDGKAYADMMYDGRIVTETKHRDDIITKIDHYDIHRAGVVNFEKIPVDASTKMPDAHMDSIEPFDYSALTEFKTSYLPGYLAERYDVTAEQATGRMTDRAINSVYEAMAATAVQGYSDVSLKSVRSMILKESNITYVMLPVWLLSTKWNGQNYLFAMNGQTGKLIGDLPTDSGAATKLFATTFGIVTVIAAAILTLLL